MLRSIIAMLALVSTCARADVVYVDVRHGAHSAGLSHSEARAVWRAAKALVEGSTGVQLRVLSWVSYPDRTVRAADLLDGYMASSAPYPRDGASSVYIGPRFLYRRSYWTAGMSSVCGNRAGVRVGNLRRFGRHRLSHAVIALAHELGHMLGATHDDSPGSVMHSAALHTLEGAGWRLHFTDQSLADVSACQRNK